MTGRMPIGALLVAGSVLVGVVGIDAATPQASSLILYRSPAPSTVTHLWTTNGKGRNAREILTIKPTGNADVLRGAFLVPDGVILATTDPKDANNADIGLLKRGATKIQGLFVVRGLYWFQPSPDGQLIAYSRSLPIAGKPLMVIARRDGRVIRTLSQFAWPIFGWSSDDRRVFTYCPTVHRRQLCSYSATTGKSTPMDLNLMNAASTPSVSPSGRWVAFYEKLGPAGERIYSTKGDFVRNLIGHGTTFAIWSPDESQMLLQGTGLSYVFSFKTKRLTSFAHRGPANLFVLDWR